MMNIHKLPKWAQQHIKDLERRLDVAKRKLDEYTNDQSPDKFYVQDFLCDENPPRSVTHHIQGSSISCKHAGVMLRVLCREGRSQCGRPHIDITYTTEDEHPIQEVVLQPYSFNAIRLMVSEHKAAERQE